MLVLNGKQAILEFLGRRSDGAWRKYRRLGMPVYRDLDGRPWAIPKELLAWRKSQGERARERRSSSLVKSSFGLHRGVIWGSVSPMAAKPRV